MSREAGDWLRIAEQEARRASVPGHLLEDAAGAAVVALVRKKPRDLALARTVARAAIGDWIKSQLGRRGQKTALRNASRISESVAAPDQYAAAEARIVLTQLMPHLSPREAALVTLLRGGMSRTEAALGLGVSQPRV